MSAISRVTSLPSEKLTSEEKEKRIIELRKIIKSLQEINQNERNLSKKAERTVRIIALHCEIETLTDGVDISTKKLACVMIVIAVFIIVSIGKKLITTFCA